MGLRPRRCILDGSRICRGLLLGAIWGILAIPSAATTVQVAASADNTLFENEFGDTSNGQGPSLYVGRNHQDEYFRRRALIEFDISQAIPFGAVIESASLSFSVTRVSSGGSALAEIELHRLRRAWGEGASNAGNGGGSGVLAEPGDATWLYPFLHESAPWVTPGGDFHEEVSGSVAADGVARYTIESTPQLVADVQGLLERPFQNFGWLLKSAEDQPGSAKVLASREHADVSLRPELSITYSIPNFEAQGDTDWDGDVDLEDLNNVRNHFGETQPGGPGDTVPFDFRVDLEDLNRVRNHFGEQSSRSPVPEPESLALAAVLLGSLLCRRGWLP